MTKASRRFFGSFCMGMGSGSMLMLTIGSFSSSTLGPREALFYGICAGFAGGVVAMVLAQDLVVWKLGTTKTPPGSDPDSPALSRARLAGFACGLGAFAAMVGLLILFIWYRT